MSVNTPECMEQTGMVQFVKIIERFPDIYDHNSETYRRWSTDKAWEQVKETVKAEMNMECKVEELKAKWKGIRSSYNRFRNKLIEAEKKGITPTKKYYLHDELKFLEPFSKNRGFMKRGSEISQDVFQDDYNDEENEQSTTENYPKWKCIKIESESSEANDVECYHDTDSQNMDTKTGDHKKNNKRKHENRGDENEDLIFFRSILPDISHFTIKEKRKLKIGVLKLIDDIENQAKKKKRKSRSDSSSS